MASIDNGQLAGTESQSQEPRFTFTLHEAAVLLLGLISVLGAAVLVIHDLIVGSFSSEWQIVGTFAGLFCPTAIIVVAVHAKTDN